MSNRPPRSLVRSTFHLDKYVNDNVNEECDEFLMELVVKLIENGFRRRSSKKLKEMPKSYIGEIMESTSATKRNDKFAAIGLRSVLRMLNSNCVNNNNSDNSTTTVVGQQPLKKRPGAILMDANLLKPSAIAHIFGLAALKKNGFFSHVNLCPFYALQCLSSILAKTLNLPQASAICIFDDDASKKILSEAAKVLHPVGLTRHSNAFVKSALYVSKTKGGSLRKMKRK